MTAKLGRTTIAENVCAAEWREDERGEKEINLPNVSAVAIKVGFAGGG